MIRKSRFVCGTGVALVLGLVLLPAVLFQQELSVSTIGLTPPGSDHLLGTDRLGRDVGIRTLQACVYTVGRALLSLMFAVLIGLGLATVSTVSFERLIDRAVAVLADTVRSFPALVLALLFVSTGVSASWILPLIFWIPIWRVTRSLLAQERARPYVLVARLFGFSRTKVVLREVLPNVLPDLFPYCVLIFSEIVAVQSSLEFLGFGPPFEQASLGMLLSEALRLGTNGYWVWLPSLIVVVGMVVSSAVFAERIAPAQKSLALE
ncbi:MAG: ABC transporter permease [Planctomycetota bacterium]|nr:ABC transporter permease [Planctomycetota bacterium]